jgi:ATP-dependent Clp protease protease subunit
MPTRKLNTTSPPGVSHYDDVAFTLSGLRRINLNGQITLESLSHVENMLAYLVAKDAKKPIMIIMNTPGGSVVDGLGIYDAILQRRSKGTPIDITVQGSAMSMGVIVLQAARYRYAYKHSQFLLHEVSYGSRGHMSAHEDEIEVARKMQVVLDGIIVGRSGMDVKELKELTKRRDYTISALEAQQHNLIDTVL